MAFPFLSSPDCIAQERGTTWDFVFPSRDGEEQPLLNLRYLNETIAGEKGFIKLSPDGNSFEKGDGQPIRFWAVNEFADTLGYDGIVRHARFLAGMGVNMCRYHVSLSPKGKGTSLYDVDMQKVRWIWKCVSIMKKEGIYATISPFWPHSWWLGEWIPPEWGIDGYQGNMGMYGVFYFNDTLRLGYKNWVRALYTLTNPYTGIALKDDPAVAIVQVMNEDGVFWWSMDDNMTPQLRELIIRKYSGWLRKEYGTIDKAFKAWGTATLPGDDLINNHPDIYSIKEMTYSRDGYKAVRMRDQTRFYAETQYNVYREMVDFYRNEIGCKQLINAMNWTAASAKRQLDLERWTYSPGEVFAMNRYYVPGHEGNFDGWRVDPGDIFAGISALKNPANFPINVKQVEGHPFMITESGWNNPHLYMAEGPFLMSVYQSLTGLDCYYWFCITDENYDRFPYFDMHRLPDGQYPMHRWTCSLPGMLAQFPANALIFRQGYLKQGEPVFRERKSHASLVNGEVSLIRETESFDNNFVPNEIPGQVMSDSILTPLAFLTGPVQVDFSADTSSFSVNRKLFSLIDLKSSTVKGITGEQELDYKNGICKVVSPMAKGVCGFLSGKEKYNLDGVKIKCSNDYAAIWVVSMDNKPMKSSGRLLVQCGTVYRPTGWQDEKGEFVFPINNKKHPGYKVISTGTMPWKAENTRVTLVIDNAVVKRAILLDVAGYALKEVPFSRSGDKITLTLPPDALYVILGK
jgi:hypothetical protein